MNGQYTIFDSGKQEAPCEYAFKRYIGQTVAFANPHHALYGLVWRSGGNPAILHDCKRERSEICRNSI